MQHKSLDKARAAFGKALDFDAKRSQLAAEGKHNLALTAGRKAGEYLGRPVALEAAALVPEEVAA